MINGPYTDLDCKSDQYSIVKEPRQLNWDVFFLLTYVHIIIITIAVHIKLVCIYSLSLPLSWTNVIINRLNRVQYVCSLTHIMRLIAIYGLLKQPVALAVVICKFMLACYMSIFIWIWNCEFWYDKRHMPSCFMDCRLHSTTIRTQCDSLLVNHLEVFITSARNRFAWFV